MQAGHRRSAAAIADTWSDEPKPLGAYPTYGDPAGIERTALGGMLVGIDNPIEGQIRASSAPVRDAQRHIDAP